MGYFAFHGESGRIRIGRRSVSLEGLGEALRGSSEKILHFGSCSVLRVPARELDAFCDLSGSPYIIGFTRDVDWLESASLDLILLDAIARRRDPSGVRRWLMKEFRGLADRLGLRGLLRLGVRALRSISLKAVSGTPTKGRHGHGARREPLGGPRPARRRSAVRLYAA